MLDPDTYKTHSGIVFSASNRVALRGRDRDSCHFDREKQVESWNDTERQGLESVGYATNKSRIKNVLRNSCHGDGPLARPLWKETFPWRSAFFLRG